ncbi:hypothetical protein MBAV_002604 [Candidatus Magnetobacterium bavaricum]|uniref:Uncharacterized protein n=1 Tax=Candidatus Magnetobacterium bavaricum TaxID=29290 RepID=A0A0F3GTA7_9BACT|nr:hypothetical protein MBAV_002604 [Candidatus Magnetobacterium bavaricum]
MDIGCPGGAGPGPDRVGFLSVVSGCVSFVTIFIGGGEVVCYSRGGFIYVSPTRQKPSVPFEVPMVWSDPVCIETAYFKGNTTIQRSWCTEA